VGKDYASDDGVQCCRIRNRRVWESFHCYGVPHKICLRMHGKMSSSVAPRMQTPMHTRLLGDTGIPMQARLLWDVGAFIRVRLLCDVDTPMNARILCDVGTSILLYTCTHARTSLV
jgi:hypothetical protein